MWRSWEASLRTGRVSEMRIWKAERPGTDGWRCPGKRRDSGTPALWWSERLAPGSFCARGGARRGRNGWAGLACALIDWLVVTAWSSC